MNTTGIAKFAKFAPANSNELEPSYDHINNIADHLFRRESGKMVSYVSKIVGFQNIEKAEDIVQDTLLAAMQTWGLKGIPENPAAWLFRVARNKALNLLKHERIESARNSIAEKEIPDGSFGFNEDMIFGLDKELLKDDVLKMMFACCNPAISEEAQITFILKIICGFSTAEVAKAFFTSEDTISKRLYRTKEYFRNYDIPLAIPSKSQLTGRIQSVLNAVYLLFNEGYNSTHAEQIVRDEIIEEALMLGKLLTENKYTQRPDTFALMALMCFHAARMESRVNKDNEIILLARQDRTKWNKDLINMGIFFLEQSSEGDFVGNYHLEAAIAFEHCIAPSFEKTNWVKILQLYNWLDKLSASPTTKLSKAVAILYVEGPAKSLEYLEFLEDKKSFEGFYLYHSIVGEIYSTMKKFDLSKYHLNEAIRLTRSESEKKLLDEKLIQVNLSQKSGLSQ